MNKISVIIPVYNCQEYINNCLYSLEAYGNIIGEIIVVNDGSTDSSEELIRKTKKKNPKIKLFTTKNSGSAAARNKGLDIAKEKYIYFLDADDYIDEKYLQTMYECIEKNDTDFVSSMFTRCEKGKKNYPTSYLDKGFYSRQNIVKEIFPQLICSNNLEVKAPLTLWTKLFKNSFLKENKIQFSEKLLMSQDVVFCILTFLNSTSFYFLPENKGYYYIYNPSSRTKNYLENIWPIMKYNFIETKKNVGMLNNKKFEAQLNNLLVRNAMTSIVNLNKKGHPSKIEVLNIINEICSDKELSHALLSIDINQLSLKRKVLYFLLKYKKKYSIYLLLKVSGV